MPDAKLSAYLDAVVTQSLTECKAEVEQALTLIEKYAGKGDRSQALEVLAVRRYLRAGGKKVHTNWAWTPEQVQQLASVGAAAELLKEAAAVQKNFAAANPGCTLAISPVRSLEKQVVLWNGNHTVQQAGSKLLTAMTKELAKADYPMPPNGASVATFTHTLRFASVNPEPSSAAPGTSDHGQLRAVDFVVMRAGKLVADTQTAQIPTVWKHDGWEKKLISAAAGTKLVGPLPFPYEPWHWRLP
jgi:hypothetical protein